MFLAASFTSRKEYRVMPTSAMLLVGHSNAGKSPLGGLIEERFSSALRRFLHLDFGLHLRMIDRGDTRAGLPAQDVAAVRSVMKGQLLDTGSFHIVQAVLNWFTGNAGFRSDSDVLVLNGVPRHLGQAHGLRGMGVSVRAVVYLDCSAENAWRRKLLADQGQGFEDRKSRSDAAEAIFHRKVESFLSDTLPLIAHYRRSGAEIVHVPVDERTSPLEMLNTVKNCGLVAGARQSHVAPSDPQPGSTP